VAFHARDCWTREIPTVSNPHAWISSLQDVAKDLDTRQFWGVLVSVPGIIDEAAGKVLFSPNLHWLERVNLPELVRHAWDLPVELVQEIRALALGQIAAGPAREDFLLVDFGQGVGGAMVLDGQLYNPAMPLSGELGHTPVPGATRRCGCGAVGCLETLVSESGLLETFRAHLGGKPRWADFEKHVRERGMPGWLGDSMDAAARVIAGALNIVGIHQVVVTGLLEQLPAAVFEHLSREIRKGSMWGRFGQVNCVLEPRRRSAGLVAAGLDRLVLPTDEETGSLLPYAAHPNKSPKFPARPSA
jgi:predicted NBD/HSP70 family sugar kinase